jgi:hypothetical protein
MPLYCFTDGKERIELIRTVRERNQPVIIEGHVFVREKVPERIRIVIPGVTHLNEDQAFNKKMRDAYKLLEQRNGKIKQNANGLSHGKVRDLWEDRPNESSNHHRISRHK